MRWTLVERRRRGVSGGAGSRGSISSTEAVTIGIGGPGSFLFDCTERLRRPELGPSIVFLSLFGQDMPVCWKKEVTVTVTELRRVAMRICLLGDLVRNS